MRSLGWKKVLRSTPVAYIMTEDVACNSFHAGSTYAELDELEQTHHAQVPSSAQLSDLVVHKDQQ